MVGARPRFGGRDRGGDEVTAAARWGRLAACGIAAFSCFACGSEKPKEEAGAEWSVEETPNPVKSPGEPGLPPVVIASELPDNFPADVPQYPGAKVETARSTEGMPGVSVSLSVPDPAEKVIAFYSDSFAAQGWATDLRRTPEGSAVFAEKENRSASALVRAGGNRTLVDLIVLER